MASKQKRAKTYGYETEVAVASVLRELGLPRITRTGSVNYSKSAPDLIQPAIVGPDMDRHPPVVNIVATRDKGQTILLTMTSADLLTFFENKRHGTLHNLHVRVQVKARARTWVGTLMRELKAAP